MTIKKIESFDPNIKRFYVPLKLTVTCPKCGKETIRDFSKHYFFYPVINKAFDYYVVCDNEECEHEREIKLRLNLNLEIIEK